MVQPSGAINFARRGAFALAGDAAPEIHVSAAAIGIHR
ncbi:hypothetical protein AKJ09_04034 [Labilithrix luteola]|uniref:Uncharacterized protein n=1 Tax=Labilithrix luteola TaxID=1391654 RepID=A0A0K1PV13_9BACT|nr:hypothetical protein AKJ09_04034 [Labilithrix luteola]